MLIPESLIASCRTSPERMAWLASLPGTIEDCADRWSLRAGPPLPETGTCSWVSGVIRSDGTPAVLKVAMPHMEGAHEIRGLRYWNGGPAVLLLEADEGRSAMLLERCRPGDSLRSQPEDTQDLIIASLLKQLWRRPERTLVRPQFRHLSEMLAAWREETLAQMRQWPDAGLVREGLDLLRILGTPSPDDTLLATDLHAGNVLRATREPWLAIDPKPFLGDPTYDLVQHLLNCEARLQTDPAGVVRSLADLSGVDAERLRLWTFARAAGDPRSDWSHGLRLEIARALAP